MNIRIANLFKTIAETLYYIESNEQTEIENFYAVHGDIFEELKQEAVLQNVDLYQAVDLYKKIIMKNMVNKISIKEAVDLAGILQKSFLTGDHILDNICMQQELQFLMHSIDMIEMPTIEKKKVKDGWYQKFNNKKRYQK